MNSLQVLAQHDEVAQQQGAERGGAGGAGAAPRQLEGSEAGGCGGLGGGHSRRSFPVSSMKTVSRVGSSARRSTTVAPASSAAASTAGSTPRRPAHPEAEAVAGDLHVGDALEGRREAVGEGLSDGVGRRGGRDGDEGVGADGGLQGLGRVEGQHPAVVDDRQAVAELVGLLHVVRGEEDGLAVVVELLEDLPQGDPALGVEAGGGLVEEEDRGPVHHRPGDHQALGHAAREGEHRGLRPARSRRNCSSSRSLSRRAIFADMPKKRPWK